MGVRPVPVAIDGQGLIPEALEEMLENWDEKARGGMRRPRVYYTVPIGQNPTGSTLPEDRRGAIYKLACKYDIIVVEDGSSPCSTLLPFCSWHILIAPLTSSVTQTLTILSILALTERRLLAQRRSSTLHTRRSSETLGSSRTSDSHTSGTTLKVGSSESTLSRRPSCVSSCCRRSLSPRPAWTLDR
jgi:hypothetical protein